MNNNDNFNNQANNNLNMNVAPPVPNPTSYGQTNNIMPNNQNVNGINNNYTPGATSNVVYQDTTGGIINNSNSNATPVENQNNGLNNLNIVGNYNGMEAPSYVNEPIVKENITQNKKNTITITKELKTVIIIALVLLVFIIIMPIISDLLNKIRFH